MLTRLLLLTVLCLSLFACSGGNDAAPVVCSASCASEGSKDATVKTTRTIATAGGLAGGLAGADFDPVSGTFTVTAAGLSAQMARFPTADYGAFLAMRDAAGIHNAYFAQGQGTQVVIYSGGLAGSVLNLASYGRTGPTELPLNGTARFNGDYAGFTTTRRINGKARLDVDFAGETITGRITDRVFRQRPDNVADVVNPLGNVILEQTSFNNDGSFSGRTGGGQIVNGQVLWNPATGSYVGLIGGASGNEVVGTIALTHRAPSGANFDEIGGFLATR
ncbi:MAG: hypothetical protein WBC85_04785 [Planktotalea sp.]|uniref:hypothetical protein n=1 Tax=Planktotalea sp. TaxID=2029877 RepID=UPI003C73730F